MANNRIAEMIDNPPIKTSLNKIGISSILRKTSQKKVAPAYYPPSRSANNIDADHSITSIAISQ